MIDADLLIAKRDQLVKTHGYYAHERFE
jgi:hypothetical protein